MVKDTRRFGRFVVLVAFAALPIFGCQEPGGSQRSQQTGGPPGGYQAPIMNFEQDIAMLREAVKVDPNNVRAWIDLGNKLMDAGRSPEAVEAYGKALEFDPSNVNVRVDMGTCYRRMGNPERAVAEYRKALESQPNHVNANLNLGVVLLHDLNDPAGALEAWEKFLSLAPDHPHATTIRNEVSKIRAAMPAKG